MNKHIKLAQSKKSKQLTYKVNLLLVKFPSNQRIVNKTIWICYYVWRKLSELEISESYIMREAARKQTHIS